MNAPAQSVLGGRSAAPHPLIGRGESAPTLMEVAKMHYKERLAASQDVEGLAWMGQVGALSIVSERIAADVRCP